MRPGERYVAIAAGSEFDLALDSNGRAWSWGSNQYGELGLALSSLVSTCSLNGPCSSEAEPVAAPANVRFTTLAVLGNDAMALDSQGHVWGWGEDEDDQLGVGLGPCVAPTVGPGLACTNKPVALPMPSGVSFSRIALSQSEFLGVPLTAMSDPD